MAPPASIFTSTSSSTSTSTSNADPDFTEFVSTRSEEAFQRLVWRHMGMVHSAACRLLGNSGDAAAADVAQTVFCQLARRAAALPPDLVVSLWLHTQTRRTALNHLRGETRRTVRERAAADLMQMNAADSPDPSELTAALTPHIDAAIGELPALEQRALALRFFDQLELQEIGGRLGLSAGAVRKRLERALEKLRHRLSRRGVTLSAAALTMWLTHESVQAVPAALTASAVSAAMAAPVAPSAGGLLSFLTVMTGIKSLLIGAALGLAGGGFWATHAPLRHDPATSAHAAALTTSPQPPPGGGNGAAVAQRYTVPVPAGNAEVLMEQLNSIIAAPDTEVTRQRLAAWLAEVPPDLWESFVNLADHRLSWSLRGRWLPDLARQWARVDPEKAILSLPKRDGYGNMSGRALAACAFKVWHESSPDKALDWLVRQQDNPALAQSLTCLISVVGSALTAISSDAAVHWAAQLQGDDLQQAVLEPLWEKLDSGKSADGWAELCRKLQEDGNTSFSQSVLKATLNRWSACDLDSPAEIGKWLSAQPDSTWKRRAAELILANALDSNREESLTQALAVVTGAGAAEASNTAARLILNSDYPGPRARQWLLPLITGPERETAIFKAARSVAAGPGYLTEGNSEAAIGWAAELSDYKVRDPLVYGLFGKLLERQQKETGSTEAALKWVESSGLSPEVQNQLRHAAKDFQASVTP